MTSDALIASLMQLSEVLLRENALGTNLAEIARTATETVPGCDGATIALSIRGKPATAAISSRVALEVDIVQYDTNEGPCLTVFSTAKAIRLDVLDATERFPRFRELAARLRIKSVLSVPAITGDNLVGTLNLYSFREHAFDHESSEIAAHVLAAQIAIAIARSPEFSAATAVAEQAQRDADDASDVALATGLLMATEDCTREQAEGLLHHAANQDEQTIVQIAQRIITQAQQHQT